MPLTIRTSIALLVLVPMTLACGRDEPEQQVPVPRTTTETANPLDRPTKLVGCLRAGDAANTYVLTTSVTEYGMSTATYHLAGAEDINLQEHVGHEVIVTGRLTGQQQVATRDVLPSPADRAEGTTGKPAVETGTQLAVRHLEVREVQRSGGECEAQ